jgi:uncharacterized protein (DUF433 family)
MNLPDFLTRDDLGHIRLTGHRIGLQDVVFYYNEGYSPEAMVCHFPTLSLALVHKVIAFYLENLTEIDAYVRKAEQDAEQLRAAALKGPGLAELRRRLEAIRRAEAS